jgi:hypothetical protein
MARYRTINNRAKHSLRPRVRRRTGLSGSGQGRRLDSGRRTHRNPGNPPFPRLGTPPADLSAWGQPERRSKNVEKVETFAFMVGFVLTGFLTLVALPLA